MSSKKRPNHQYSESALQDALAQIRYGKLTIRKASKNYGVPRSTIQDKLKLQSDIPRKMGPSSILSVDEEKRIVQWVINLTKCGFPLKTDDLLNTVQKIVQDDKRKTPFRNGRPGRTWYHAFLRRNSELTHRTPENFSTGRAIITKEFIQKWFDELSEYTLVDYAGAGPSTEINELQSLDIDIPSGILYNLTSEGDLIPADSQGTLY